jgi:hypothetical protein
MAKKKEQAGNGMSFDSMLGQTEIAGSDSKKKKDALPLISLSEELTKKLKDFISQKAKMKEAESEMRLAEQPVLETCLERMDKDALEGEFHASYELKGTDGTKAKFISTDKFSLSQEKENIQALRELLGDEFDKEVVKKPTVQLKSEVFENKELQAELVQIMGDKFGKFFETVVKYSTKEGFDERMYKIANGSKAKVMQICSVCGKAKPYIK